MYYHINSQKVQFNFLNTHMPLTRFYILFFLLSILTMIYSCGTAVQVQIDYKGMCVKQDLGQALNNEVIKWKGVPHCLGGTTLKCVDCSGLVMKIFESMCGIRLPRTTKEQAKIGTSVSRKELIAGDLVFFKPGFKKRHVGICLDSNRFVHTSVSKGVTISRLDNPYWKKHYWKAKRIIE